MRERNVPAENRYGQLLPNPLSGEAVAIVVKRYLEQLGFVASALPVRVCAAGLATSAAAEANAP